MANITQIQLRLLAASRRMIDGPDGDIFLGIAGREFAIDDGRGGAAHGNGLTYIVGESASILDAEFNDPRSPQLDTLNVYKFPTYIRFEPRTRDDNWLLSLVEVTVWSPEADEIFISVGPVGSGPFWLGQRRGKIVYLWPSEPTQAPSDG